MNSEQVTNESRPAPSEASRGRSTIEFPYLDLDAAIEVATAVHAVGGTSCGWDQLAAQMKQSAKGGGFRLRVMTGRSFGLLEYDRGTVTLTELGIRAIDAKHARAAKAEAFLAVPLHKAAYERLKGQMLPPPPAIERMLEGLGVAPKQKDKARQVFIRSAKQAGYFDLDPERIVSPPLSNGPISPQPKPDTPQYGGGAGGGSGSSLDPLIDGLVKRLPPPGTRWPVAARIKWLQAASNNFDLIYEADDSDNGASISIDRETEQGRHE